MHIHTFAVGLQTISSSAAGNERAAAAEQAAETRRRLQKSAQAMETEADPDATLLLGQWLDARPSQALPGDAYHAAEEGKDIDLG